MTKHDCTNLDDNDYDYDDDDAMSFLFLSSYEMIVSVLKCWGTAGMHISCMKNRSLSEAA